MLSSRVRFSLWPPFLIALAMTLGGQRHTLQPRLSQSAARSAVAKLPLYFEAIDKAPGEETVYTSRGAGYGLWLQPNGTDLVLCDTDQRGSSDTGVCKRQQGDSGRRRVALQTRLLGANPHPRLQGMSRLPGKTNYLLGNDPRKWRTDCPTFARVKYEEIYPGIDLVYYGRQGQLEYDFIVHPGVNPDCIRFQTKGAEPPILEASGDLLLRAGGREIRQRKPLLYQEVAGHRHPVTGDYQLSPNGEVGFHVGAYDASAPLVIDPVIAYSTYMGGSDTDGIMGVAMDLDGNVYATGWTVSRDFPIPPGAPEPKYGGDADDAFVIKLNAAGNTLAYATYLGGKGDTYGNPPTSGSDEGYAIAVDQHGNACVVGQAASTNFPVAHAIQPVMATDSTYSDNSDGFVTKLNAAGNGLVFSTYIGSPVGFDAAYGVAVDQDGNLYVVGETAGSSFPVTSGAYLTTAPRTGSFVMKLGPDGALAYSTFLPGNITQASAVAVDGTGNAYVTGHTSNASYPTSPNAFGQTLAGGADVFVTKLNGAGSALVYSTLLGGSGRDEAFSIAVDSAGHAYVTGDTLSANFPLTNPVQATFRGGDRDAFVTELNADGSGLVFSTFLGGGQFDRGRGIAVDANGNVWVSGATDSTDFVTTPDALQPHNAGLRDVFITELGPGGNPIVFSTYLGGSGNDGGQGTFTNGPTLALDRSGGLVVGAVTYSHDILLKNAFRVVPSGPSEGFITRIMWNAPLAPTAPQATPVSTSQLLISWTDMSDNESDFQIQRRTGTGDFVAVGRANANIRSFQDSGLQPGTSYVYRILARNDVGNSAFSPEVTGTTRPNPPTALTASAVNQHSVNLQWTDNSANEDSFEIERSVDASNFTSVGAVGADITAYTDNTAQPNTTYTYRARSVVSGVGSTYAVSAPVTTPPDPPLAPTNLATTDVRDVQVSLSWTTSSGATSYNVKRSTASGGPFAPLGTSFTSGYTDASVDSGVTYFYVVTAVNAGGESPNSNTTAVYTGYTISGKVTAGGVGVGGATVYGGAGSATTAADGTYTLVGLSAGNYLIQAFAPGYDFPNQLAHVGPSQTGIDFIVATNQSGATYTISGKVTAGGVGVGGAMIYGGAGSAATAPDGTYTLTGLTAGNYLVQAFAPGYDFPRQVAAVGPSQTGIDFAVPVNLSGTTYTISGKVMAGGVGVGGATVYGGAGSATTAPDGTYMLTGLSAGNYLIQAFAPGYDFPNQFAHVGPSQTGIDFVVATNQSGATYTISGKVTAGGVGVGGATVYAGAGSAATAPDGTYTLTGLAAGNYLVQAFAAGFSFPNHTALVGPSRSGVDFAVP